MLKGMLYFKTMVLSNQENEGRQAVMKAVLKWASTVFS